MKNLSKRTSQFTKIIAVALALSFAGCAKDGATGPQGPAGTPGKDGNANVKSQVIFISGSEWINAAGYSYVTKIVPEITADIVTKGTVDVYAEDNGKWWSLPLTTTTQNGGVLAYGYAIENGKITLDISVNVNVTLTSADIGNSNFKIVVIAGAAKNQKANSNGNDLVPTTGFAN